MSTDDPLDEFDALPEDQKPEWAKALRQRQKEDAKRADEAEKRAAGLERKAIFDDLNIPTEGPGALFRDAYTGDLDADAVRAKAESYGVIAPPPPPEPSVPQEELATHQRASEATAVSEPDPGFQAKLDAAQSEHEVIQILAEAGRLAPAE